MTFERENRYFVFKRSDHTPEAIATLEYLAKTRDHIRDMMGKQPLECVVVESDWPEYETVWDMIQGRVEGEQAELCPNCDAPLPQGCGGVFKDDGNACHGFGQDVPLSDTAQIRRDMVLENNHIAEQADAAHELDSNGNVIKIDVRAYEGNLQFDDPYQMMAFALFRTMEE